MAINLASLIRRSLLPSWRHGFLRDERGVTAIEFGLLAVPFFAIIGAILETSLVFLSGQILDSAVQDTSRLIRTGQMQNATMQTFRDKVCDRLYGLFTCANLRIEVQSLTSFSAANIKPPVDFACKTKVDCDKWTRNEAFDQGVQSSIMLVQVYYRWPTILNIGGMTLAELPTGQRILGAASVFRNEPF